VTLQLPRPGLAPRPLIRGPLKPIVGLLYAKAKHNTTQPMLLKQRSSSRVQGTPHHKQYNSTEKKIYWGSHYSTLHNLSATVCGGWVRLHMSVHVHVHGCLSCHSVDAQSNRDAPCWRVGPSFRQQRPRPRACTVGPTRPSHPSVCISACTCQQSARLSLPPRMPSPPLWACAQQLPWGLQGTGGGGR
jgi:hypothetical protein